MKNVVIYTAIFGGKDALIEPAFITPNADFVCFTDADVSSPTWQVRKPVLTENDPVRLARKHKVLAHELFPEYEYSVWVDGNILVRGNVEKLITAYLKDFPMAVYDHRKTVGDARGSAYEEADALIALEAKGKYKDDAALIRAQMDRYRAEGYPGIGLLSSMELVRRHNAPEVVRVMEAWWKEIEAGSRRDQLSFNYAAWKNNFTFALIEEDSRNNEFFLHTPHAQKGYYDSGV